MNKRERENSIVDWKKIQVQENCELEKTFGKLAWQFESIVKNYVDLSKHIANRTKHIEDEMNRDKTLFSLATRHIQKTFVIRAELDSKDVNVSLYYL